MKYDAFISYSRIVDTESAKALQLALSRFDKSFFGTRSSRIFVDTPDSTPTDSLPTKLTDALERSKYFILLASPEAARSQLIEEELSRWLSIRPIETVIIVLTSGEITSDVRGDELRELNSLPPILRRALEGRPISHIDLRWARGVKNFQDRYQFLDTVAQIAAVLQGVSKDTVLDTYTNRARKLKRVTVAMSLVLVLMTIGSTMSATYALRQVKLAQQALVSAQESKMIAQRQSEIAEKERAIAMQYQHESENNAAHARMLQEQLQEQLVRLRRGRVIPSETVVSTSNLELEQQITAAEAKADDYKRQFEDKSILADQYKQQSDQYKQQSDQYKQQSEGLARRVSELQQGQAQGNFYLRELARQNLTVILLVLICSIILILFSTRLILLLLQLDIGLLKPIAIAFFYSPLGRWKLYRKYKKRLKEDANLHYHAKHYIDLPFESSDHAGAPNALQPFLEESMKTQNVCIIAGGGQGKTTLAYKLALQSINGELLIGRKSPVPVIVDGLTYDGNLLESITAALKQHRVYVNSAIVGSQIAAGNILVIVDGWSEVREFYSEPQESSDIPKFISGNPDTRFVFTSRSDLPAAIRQTLGNAAIVKLKDLDDETLEEFLRKYIERRKDQVKILVKELKESPNQIPQTPLMIRLVAEIYDRTGQVPKDRISLFSQYVEKLFRPEIIERIDVAGLLYVIKHLVRHTYIATDGNRGFPIYKGVELIEQIKTMVGNFGIRLLPIDLLKLLSHAGLYKRSGEYFRFFHDSFESYFAARLLDDDFREGKYELLVLCASNVRFIETVSFLVGMCKERNEHEELIRVIGQARRTSGMPADVIAQ